LLELKNSGVLDHPLSGTNDIVQESKPHYFARRANLPRPQLLISSPNQHYTPRRPVPARGALRDRHGRWARDAMDVAARADERRYRGRRSRVVLTPRRWRQGGGAIR
jgi:hypothetical protein